MVLHSLLREYLIKNGSLPLPERGLLTIDYKPAYLRKVDSTMVSPTSDILFVPLEMQEPEMKNLVSFLSKKLNISFEQANDLLREKNVVDAMIKEMSDLITWPDSGNAHSKSRLQSKTSSTVMFSNYLPSFPIEKIHRQPITPAETITPSAEIISEETYPEYEERVEKDYWWIWATGIAVVSVLLILFR